MDTADTRCQPQRGQLVWMMACFLRMQVLVAEAQRAAVDDWTDDKIGLQLAWLRRHRQRAVLLVSKAGRTGTLQQLKSVVYMHLSQGTAVEHKPRVEAPLHT